MTCITFDLITICWNIMLRFSECIRHLSYCSNIHTLHYSALHYITVCFTYMSCFFAVFLVWRHYIFVARELSKSWYEQDICYIWCSNQPLFFKSQKDSADLLQQTWQSSCNKEQMKMMQTDSLHFLLSLVPSQRNEWSGGHLEWGWDSSLHEMQGLLAENMTFGEAPLSFYSHFVSRTTSWFTVVVKQW